MWRTSFQWYRTDSQKKNPLGKAKRYGISVEIKYTKWNCSSTVYKDYSSYNGTYLVKRNRPPLRAPLQDYPKNVTFRTSHLCNERRLNVIPDKTEYFHQSSQSLFNLGEGTMRMSNHLHLAFIKSEAKAVLCSHLEKQWTNKSKELSQTDKNIQSRNTKIIWQQARELQEKSYVLQSSQTRITCQYASRLCARLQHTPLRKDGPDTNNAHWIWPRKSSI